MYNDKQYKGLLYGVELEIEAVGLYAIGEEFDEESEEYVTVEPEIPLGWELRQEDSIAGPEVVFAGPTSFTDSCILISNLFRDVSQQGYSPSPTPRGSMHVHVNVSDLNYSQLSNFIMACAWAEPLLIEAAGKGRKGNLFAMSYATAPQGWHDIVNSVRNQQLLLCADTHYMAINFRQISKHGSVEFRMGPSMRDATQAIGWLHLIHLVAKEAREAEIAPDTPPAFIEELLQVVPAAARNKVLAQAKRQAGEIWFKLNAPSIPVKPWPFTEQPIISANEFVTSDVVSDWASISLSPAPTPLV